MALLHLLRQPDQRAGRLFKRKGSVVLVSLQHVLNILLEDLSLLLLRRPTLRKLFRRFVAVGQDDYIQHQRSSEEIVEIALLRSTARTAASDLPACLSTFESALVPTVEFLQLQEG